MNFEPDHRDFQLVEPPRPWDGVPESERAILAACLMRPEALQGARWIIQPSDFEFDFNGRVFEILLALADEGRSPSIEAVCATFRTDEEFLPGMTVRSYLNAMTRDLVTGVFAPWRDAAETMADRSRRGRLAQIGETIMRSAPAIASLADFGLEAVAEIDTILSELRRRERTAYSAGDAGDAVFAMLDGERPQWPSTGLADLDRALSGGWPRGQLSILAGRPGMGKTAVSTSCAIRAARKGHEQMILSLEMQKEQTGARMLTDLAFTGDNPIEYKDVLAKTIDERQRSRLEAANVELKRLPIHIEEQRGLTISEVAARVRKHANQLDKNGCKLETLYVDHMGLIAPSSRYAGNRTNEVGEIAKGLATIAKDLDLAVVALCQLSRKVEDRDNKRPGPADLRDSGDIEQEASVIVFPYRAAYYLEKIRFDDDEKEMKRVAALEKLQFEIELGLAKNRNGSTGIIKAFCNIGANAIRDGANYW